MKLKCNSSRDTPSPQTINISAQSPNGSPQASSPLSVAQAQIVQQAVDDNIKRQLSTSIDDALRSRVQLGPGHYSDLISRIERLEEFRERRDREDLTLGKWSVEIDSWPNGRETLRLRKNGRERVVDMDLSKDIAPVDEALGEEASQGQNDSEHRLGEPLVAQRDQGQSTDEVGDSDDVSELVLAHDELGGEWEDLSASEDRPDFVPDADIAAGDDDDDDDDENAGSDGEIEGPAEAEDDAESESDEYVGDEEDESEVFGESIVDKRIDKSPRVRIDQVGELLQRQIDRRECRLQPRRKRKQQGENNDEDTAPRRSRERKSLRLDDHSRDDLQEAYPQDLRHGCDQPLNSSVSNTSSGSEGDSGRSRNVVHQRDIATGLSPSADHVKERAAKLAMSGKARLRNPSRQQPPTVENTTASATQRTRIKSNRGMRGYKLIDEDHYRAHYANKFIGVDRDPLKARGGAVFDGVAERTRGATVKKRSEPSIEDQYVAGYDLTLAPQPERSTDAVLVAGQWTEADDEYREESGSGAMQQGRRRKRSRKHGRGKP